MSKGKKVRLYSVDEKDRKWLDAIFFEHYGRHIKNKGDDLMILVKEIMPYSFLSEAAKRVEEKQTTLTDDQEAPPASLAGKIMSDPQTCQINRSLLKFLDNSILYEKERINKPELIELIEEAIDKKVSRRKWDEISELLQDTGRVKYNRGKKEAYTLSRTNMRYATKETKAKVTDLNKLIQSKFEGIKFGYDNRRELAIKIYKKYGANKLIKVEQICNDLNINRYMCGYTLDDMREAKVAKAPKIGYIMFMDVIDEIEEDIEV